MSVVYSILAFVWIVFKAISAVNMLLDNLPLNAAYDITWIILAFWLRSCAVSGSEYKHSKNGLSLRKAPSTCSCVNVAHIEGSDAESYVSQLRQIDLDIEKCYALLICPVCGSYWEETYSKEKSQVNLTRL